MMVYLSSPTFTAFSLVMKQVGVQHHLEGGPELVRHHLKRALLTRFVLSCTSGVSYGGECQEQSGGVQRWVCIGCHLNYLLSGFLQQYIYFTQQLAVLYLMQYRLHRSNPTWMVTSGEYSKYRLVDRNDTYIVPCFQQSNLSLASA